MIRLVLCTQGTPHLQTAFGRLSCEIDDVTDVISAHLLMQLGIAGPLKYSLQAFSVLIHRLNRCLQIPAWSSACKERALCLGNSQQL